MCIPLILLTTKIHHLEKSKQILINMCSEIIDIYLMTYKVIWCVYRLNLKYNVNNVNVIDHNEHNLK